MGSRVRVPPRSPRKSGISCNIASQQPLSGKRMGSRTTMSLDEIVDGIIRLLRARDELGGHFQQEPYKGDFFRLFVAASETGLLKQSAPKSLKLDSLISIISARD